MPPPFPPPPQLYDSDRESVADSERAFDTPVGIVKAQLPELGLTWNSSSILWITPPPLGGCVTSDKKEKKAVFLLAAKADGGWEP